MLTIDNITTSADRKLVECTVDFGMQGSTQLYFRAEQPVLQGNTSAVLSAVLLPCMKLMTDCHIKGAVSRRLLQSTETIQNIFNGWDPGFNKITISADSVVDDPGFPDEERGVGSFFSGGIDSLYTLAEHRDEVDTLVLIHGFDIDLDDSALWQQVTEHLGAFARDTGKTLIEIETNLGVFLRKYVGWSFGHGPALAAVGHLLSPRLRRMYIPGTHTLADDVAWGSHPAVDPLWSSESLEFVHDGETVTRVQKTERVAAWPEAMQCLRVCWKNTGGAYNCGRCSKCLRTMVTLQMIAALDACEQVFEVPLDLGRVGALRLYDDNSRAFAREILADERLGKQLELRAAVEKWLIEPGGLQRVRLWLRGIRLKRAVRTWLAGFRSGKRQD